MNFYSKYLKYKQKYLELKNIIGGKKWNSGLTEEQIEYITEQAKKVPKDERKKLKNQLAARFRQRLKEEKREEKKEAQKASESRPESKSSGKAAYDYESSDDESSKYPPSRASPDRKTIDTLTILGLTLETANKDSIKAAYRRLALIYHPDKSSSESDSPETLANQEKFKQINNAKEYLDSLPEYK
jgi:DnaJ-domain-containing protein 1